MKKKFLSLVFIVGLITTVKADFSAHQFHFTDNIELSTCITNATKAVKKHGFLKVNEHNNAKYAYSTVFAMNSEGYSV
jgi:hypothetical protein